VRTPADVGLMGALENTYFATRASR